MSMYDDENTTASTNFVPRQINSGIWIEANESPTQEQPPCLPKRIFQKHSSLIELSAIAVTEKETLDKQESSQCSGTSACSSAIDIENKIQGQDYGCLNQNVGAELEVHSTPNKISSIESTPCNNPLTPTANLKMLMSVVSPAIRDRDEKKRDLFVGNDDNVSNEIIIEKPNAYSRKDKSLGLLCQRFLAMFPENTNGNAIEISLDEGGVVTLEDAATVLLEEHDERNVKYKTKVRRLYDIANILSSLELIEKVHIRGAVGKKPGFKWIGVDIESLPNNAMPDGNVVTFKTKHSLLPDPTSNPTNKIQPHILPAPSSSHSATANPNKSWTKSASCSASFVRRSSSNGGGIKRERSNSSTAEKQDGFHVHEFASSPVNLFGRDMSLYSPTEVTFREEIQKLREKFPDHIL
ncbi:transcription factor E2F7-like [Dendronephthya gigantea]|uniref:transcription factor E2F7-like n=1 Tax=Dendronephthya gigantea TaxID=151771 RepID=UPI00106A72B7|nr:transcription factor E2F7-like [Dendronephthya gigantea]